MPLAPNGCDSAPWAEANGEGGGLQGCHRAGVSRGLGRGLGSPWGRCAKGGAASRLRGREGVACSLRGLAAGRGKHATIHAGGLCPHRLRYNGSKPRPRNPAWRRPAPRPAPCRPRGRTGRPGRSARTRSGRYPPCPPAIWPRRRARRAAAPHGGRRHALIGFQAEMADPEALIGERQQFSEMFRVGRPGTFTSKAQEKCMALISGAQEKKRCSRTICPAPRPLSAPERRSKVHSLAMTICSSTSSGFVARSSLTSASIPDMWHSPRARLQA